MSETLTVERGTDSQQRMVRRWLVAEYCGHDIYMGWHLYLRDNPGYQKRNEDGSWGWIRGPVWPRDRAENRTVAFFATLGIELKGDWTCPQDGCAEFVKRYPLKGRKVWGEKRGGVEVLEGYWGDLTLYTPNSEIRSNADFYETKRSNRKARPDAEPDNPRLAHLRGHR